MPRGTSRSRLGEKVLKVILGRVTVPQAWCLGVQPALLHNLITGGQERNIREPEDLGGQRDKGQDWR